MERLTKIVVLLALVVGAVVLVVRYGGRAQNAPAAARQPAAAARPTPARQPEQKAKGQKLEVQEKYGLAPLSGGE
jgi:hypothetical protein